MINYERKTWVFIEQEAGKIADVSLELVCKGRELADQLGVELEAVLLGDNVADKVTSFTVMVVTALFWRKTPAWNHSQFCRTPKSLWI